jgi:acyltransferase
MRLNWIDYLKALGIFLVVYGHTVGVIPFVEKWIFSFHMPLFFLVSGFLIKPENLDHGFKPFFIKTTKDLIPPYLIFAVAFYLFWLLIARHIGQDAGLATDLISPFLAILYGTGSHSTMQLNPIVLWFFPCLYITHLMTYFIVCKKLYISLAISVVLLTIGILIPKNIALPFEFEEALVAQFFVVSGFAAKRQKVMEYVGSHQPFLVGVLLVAAGSFIGLWNGRVDMRTSNYGNFGYFLCSSVAITFGLAMLFYKLPKLKLAELMSKNTILIFPLHFFVYSCFEFLYIHILNNLAIRENSMVAFLSSIANCLIILAVSPLFRKYLPWTYGIKD